MMLIMLASADMSEQQFHVRSTGHRGLIHNIDKISLFRTFLDQYRHLACSTATCMLGLIAHYSVTGLRRPCSS